WLVLLAACGGGAATPGADAPPTDAPPDMPPGFAACDKFATTPVRVPAHVTGAIAGANIQAPATCTSVDAPYGILSGGPDSVVEVGGLAPGAAYIVHLAGAADLSFYVVTGCSTPSGPDASECLLFEDATPTGDEV